MPIGQDHASPAPSATLPAPAPTDIPARGPVAQWLEPTAHNGLVAGSSPAGPTTVSLSYSLKADRWFSADISAVCAA